jgi:hypothetical protein
LSEQRAKTVLAMLTGDRKAFVDLCEARRNFAGADKIEIDVTQIFDWTTRAFGFTCKPTTLEARPSYERYGQFRTSFNDWVDGRDAQREPDARAPSKLATSGGCDKTIWGAIYDLYEFNLREELGETAVGVENLRNLMVWVDPSRKALGFGERFPIDAGDKNDYRSQANRRVEILMFDPGEEPDLEAAQAQPETTEIYLPGCYEKIPLPPIATDAVGLEFVEVGMEPSIELISIG